MKRKSISLKTSAIFLTLSLGLPAAAYPEFSEGQALRQSGVEGSSAKEELIQALGRSASPSAGAEEKQFWPEEIRERIEALVLVTHRVGEAWWDRKGQESSPFNIMVRQVLNEQEVRERMEAAGVTSQDIYRLYWGEAVLPRLALLSEEEELLVLLGSSLIAGLAARYELGDPADPRQTWEDLRSTAPFKLPVDRSQAMVFMERAIRIAGLPPSAGAEEVKAGLERGVGLGLDRARINGRGGWNHAWTGNGPTPLQASSTPRSPSSALLLQTDSSQSPFGNNQILHKQSTMSPREKKSERIEDIIKQNIRIINNIPSAGAEEREREYDGLTDIRNGEVAGGEILGALKPGHKQLVVPSAGTEEITRIFRMPGMQLQASVADVVGEQNIQNIPENPAGRMAFWEEWNLRAGDVILLDLPAGEEPVWLPAELPSGVAVLNLPQTEAAGLLLPEMASMVESALRRGGILPRVEEVIQVGAAQLVLDLGT